MVNLAQFVDDQPKIGPREEQHWELSTPDEIANSDELSEIQAPGSYETPRIIVIGKVRKLTTGSASSGNQDANSQYYW
jgi:hypothetical protein